MSQNTADLSSSTVSQLRPVLEGDALLHELRQGWTGLPNKTLFALAMGGLRVRMMRSTVTMLSIVLAIAFLTYTGVSGTVNHSLALVAGQLADQAATPIAGVTSAQVGQIARQVAQADLLANQDAASLKAMARQFGLHQISKELTDLPIAQRNLARLRDEAQEKEQAHQAAMASATILPTERNQAYSQMEASARLYDAAQAQLDKMIAKVNMGKWLRSDELPPDTTQEQMAQNVRQHMAGLYHDLVLNIATPARISNENLDRLDTPLSLARQAGMDSQVNTLTLAIDRIRAQRQSESLMNMLRRAGVNIEKTLQGNPMDVWLIVMALMTCAVGIANAMLMSVTERFREIGTMKCLGAQDSLVVKLFLLESAFLGVIGAGGGIIIGVVVSLLASLLQFGSFGVSHFPLLGAIPTVLWSVLGGIILSVAGAVYPAYAASRMRPVDALRVDE